MKGKGKRTPVQEDCPLSFPEFELVEHKHSCPKYTSILSRSTDESVSLDEVNTLQTELESLLASTAKRMRLLESEIQILVDWQEKRIDKKPSDLITPVKRGKGAEEKPNKKLKESSDKGKGKVYTGQTGPGRPKSKGKQTKVQDYDFVDSPQDLPRLPRNDLPDKFWASLEPYCQEISSEDCKVLEEIIRSHEDDSEYFKTPSLGKHYSIKWAQEDLVDEQKDGVRITEKRKSLTNNTSANHKDEGSRLLQKAEDESEESSPFGPLTQRLVSALIEENIMTPIDDSSMTEITGRDPSESIASLTPRQLAKQLNIGNTASLERRIKRELEEQGLLDMEEHIPENPEDEVLTELRRKQQELKVLGQHNLVTTKRLLKLAKDEMARQDMRKKLIAADAEVMDAYRRIQASRQKKKTPTKKEKDMLVKALKEREQILKAIDA